ncbi:NAD-dependent epimerase/dehydratase family protein [Aminiphilus circumscriptus]|uniref:NAD-dependent epimerase/dehydratase family protein n=1 Tax=Aminiphilus circumscriptus TaxID=290732 RepID=UPI00054D6405|nr:NAD(P)-dependent oxidoreductase [Aminiphilus circumscriptus]
MNCLLFGASGLIGTHLMPLLQATYTVVTIGRRKTNTYSADLEREWTSDPLPGRIDSVVYLAQSEKFREFPEFTESVFRVNTLSLLKALDYARRAGARTFVYTSSGGVYGNSAEVCHEDAPVCPHGELGFYLGTKMCGEILVENYTSYMNVVVLRPFFVYGPGQRKNMLIPRLVERVRNGQPIQLVGEDGLHINPTYVEDAAHAILKALTLEMSCKVNIAGPEILSMRQIGEHIGQALGKETLFEQTVGTPSKIVGSIEKMSKILWRPQISFAEGVKRYVKSLCRRGD